MILIVKCYYPDYGNDCDCGCSTGTDTIEGVFELNTDKTEPELMQEYDARLEAMVKLKTAYKSTTRKAVLNRWKYNIGKIYTFLTFLSENYEKTQLNYIEIR